MNVKMTTQVKESEDISHVRIKRECCMFEGK
jgi:hypothetical protein